MDLQAVLQFLEGVDIRIDRIVPVPELIPVLDEVVDNRFDVTGGMKTQDVRRLLHAYLVITEILDVPDQQADLSTQPFFDRSLDEIANLAHRIVPRCNVEDARNLWIGLNGADISCGGVLD